VRRLLSSVAVGDRLHVIHIALCDCLAYVVAMPSVGMSSVDLVRRNQFLTNGIYQRTTLVIVIVNSMGTARTPDQKQSQTKESTLTLTLTQFAEN